MGRALPEGLSGIIAEIKAALSTGADIYLVGGAVRDALLGKRSHDLDFVLGGDVLKTARKVADAFGAAYYTLDEKRATGRVLLDATAGPRQVLDFAAFRGPDLESDLRARDFTINAMAVSLSEPDKLIDPLGGFADLRAKTIRAASPTTFEDDPLRLMRAVRQAASLGFQIAPETLRLMRPSTFGLARVSNERIRDELFRILDSPSPAAAIQVLDRLGLLPYFLPEILETKSVTQSPPHVYDVWTHGLKALERLVDILAVLTLPFEPESAENLSLGMVSLRLGRFREQITQHMEGSLNPDRSLRQLLLFAVLMHDVGKPATRSVEKSGRIRFFEHDQAGAEVVARRARALHLSNEEVARLKIIVRHHLRPILLTQTGRLPSRRAIYRFYRDTGEAGVDVCLLSLADKLATYGPALQQDAWEDQLNVIRALFEGYWEQHEQRVAPPVVVDGNDLIHELGVKPGPVVGKLLDAIREAQAMGEVKNRREALDLARRRLKQVSQ